MIFSITNRKSYIPKAGIENYKSIRSDEIYLIFGNSELRIKLKEMDVYCRIGSLHGYFESEEYEPEMLVGPAEDWIKNENATSPLKGYELFSVEFE